MASLLKGKNLVFTLSLGFLTLGTAILVQAKVNIVDGCLMTLPELVVLSPCESVFGDLPGAA